MSALKVSEMDVMAMYGEMTALNSEKEQRGVLKAFLLSSGEDCWYKLVSSQ